MTPPRKLSPLQVAAVAASLVNGRSVAELALKYGVARSTIRRSLRRDTPEGVRRVKLAPCGTPGAYKRHIAHREIPCDSCLLANRVYEQKRRGRTVG